MKRILITGATGNIGSEVVHYLNQSGSEFEIIAAVRNVEKAKERFREYSNLMFREFDFEAIGAFKNAIVTFKIQNLCPPPPSCLL